MFKDCKTANETHKTLVKIIKNTSLSDIQEEIAKSFYNVDSIVKFIYIAIITNNNAILHGPGGFGKSQIIKAFFKFFNIEPIVVVGHSGMDVEALLGIPNIKKLTEESAYEIAFEKSVFAKPGVLILEEFLDVKPVVASALKDIITEGGYRRGDEFIPSKIGSIFICSNKSPDEVVVDLSTAAFYKERFPVSEYVIWSDYSSKAYLNLFDTVFGLDFNNKEKLQLVAEVCAISCTSDIIISPRIAINAAHLFLGTEDIESLNMISSLDLSKIDEIKSRLRIESQQKYLGVKFINLISLLLSAEAFFNKTFLSMTSLSIFGNFSYIASIFDSTLLILFLIE